MKILADENVFNPIIKYLKGIGNEVVSVREKFSGISDEEVYKMACKNQFVIITMDKDFSRTFRFPPLKCGGIVVIKIYRKTVEQTLAIFRKYFSSIREKDVCGNLVVVTSNGIRIRKSIK